MNVRRVLPTVVTLVVGVALGVAIAWLGGRDAGPAGPPAPPSSVAVAADPDARAELPAPDAAIGADRAEDPESAIRGFLAAEATGDWAGSHAFLTEELRTVAYPTAAAWVAAHGDFPIVTGYRVDAVEVDGDRATATTLTGFEPGLDPVLGLVAARGRTTWPLVREGSVWRVDASASANQPVHPPADGIQEVVARWVDARIACADTTGDEAGLIGAPALAEPLCGSGGRPDVGPVTALADSDRVAPLLSAWGPEVFGWARTVHVGAAQPFELVMGPIGEDWRVVAVIPA